MTDLNPSLCRACIHLDRTTTVPGGREPVPRRCAAYPTRIPADITARGGDHHVLRGDEMAGLVFELADTDEARTALTWWQRTFNPTDQPKP